MPTPEFILKLREKIGHDPLWLVGVTACVLDARGWYPETRTHLSGIMEGTRKTS